jgi:hypothetical protein
MKESFTAVIKQSNNWWIGWIEEISGVNCQNPQRRTSRKPSYNPKEAPGFNRYEAIEAAGGVYEERTNSTMKRSDTASSS